MNNTFNNTQNKNFKANINKSIEGVNNEGQISPNNILKNSLENNNSQNSHNYINLKKNLLSKCKITNNHSMNNDKFSSVLKTNPNDKISKITNIS